MLIKVGCMWVKSFRYELGTKDVTLTTKRDEAYVVTSGFDISWIPFATFEKNRWSIQCFSRGAESWEAMGHETYTLPGERSGCSGVFESYSLAKAALAWWRAYDPSSSYRLVDDAGNVVPEA